MMTFRRYVESVVYPVQPLANTKRYKTMQVLALGLSRSGTDSLRTALAILGYEHIYHGFDVPGSDSSISKAWTDLGRRKWGPDYDKRPLTVLDFDRILGHCEAVTDQPCACFPLELIEAYPDAKVILNYRDAESWYESIRSTFGAHFASWEFRWLSLFDPALYWLQQVFMMYERGYFQGSMIRNAKRVQGEHYATIRGGVSASRLLEWKIEDGWGPLCKFLEKPVPQAEFPRGNTPKEMFDRAAKIRAGARRRAYRNLTLFTTLIAGLAAGGVILLFPALIQTNGL